MRFMTIIAIVSLATGCNAITDMQIPDGVESPATYNNREGATRLTLALRGSFATTVVQYLVSSGLLTDELESVPQRLSVLDQRLDDLILTPPHEIRALARLARGVVSKYVPGETSAWQAVLLLYEAYAEILIADGWCSGVPLSTLDFEGDWTYKPGSVTDEIYAHAIQLLDSADVRSADSIPLRSAIRVLKARAQMASGQYTEARETVRGIDSSFRYGLNISFRGNNTSEINRYARFSNSSISDKEGVNGLPYRSSGDPRTRAAQRSQGSITFWFPLKYDSGDSVSFTLASGVEAQLILAEVALLENEPQRMMAILNALRTTGTYTVSSTQLAEGGQMADTLWHAGIGGVAGLRPLTDPGSLDARRHLLFSERAAWLFLTGARQGDLRRLVRKYGMDREQVYPTGQYINGTYVDVYGSSIFFTLSAEEYRNPLFEGCRYDD